MSYRIKDTSDLLKRHISPHIHVLQDQRHVRILRSVKETRQPIHIHVLQDQRHIRSVKETHQSTHTYMSYRAWDTLGWLHPNTLLLNSGTFFYHSLFWHTPWFWNHNWLPWKQHVIHTLTWSVLLSLTCQSFWLLFVNLPMLCTFCLLYIYIWTFISGAFKAPSQFFTAMSQVKSSRWSQKLGSAQLQNQLQFCVSFLPMTTLSELIFHCKDTADYTDQYDVHMIERMLWVKNGFIKW